MSLIFFSSDLIHLLRSRPDIYSLLRVRTCKVSSERSNARRYPPARLDLMTGSVLEVEFVPLFGRGRLRGFCCRHSLRAIIRPLVHPAPFRTHTLEAEQVPVQVAALRAH